MKSLGWACLFETTGLAPISRNAKEEPVDGGGPNDPEMDQTKKAKIGDYFMQFTENLSKQGTQHTLSHFFFLSVTSQGASVVHNVPQSAGKGLR